MRGLVAASIAPLVGLALNRWGIRWVMTAGALVAASGFFVLSRAQSLVELYLSYSLMVAVGTSFSTVLPAQTLAMFWFERYRARATSIILVGGALVGAIVTPVDDYILRHYSWRSGWVVIACTSVIVALVAATFVRNRPEDLGLQRDGDREPVTEPNGASAEASAPEPPAASIEPQMSAAEAIRMPQFYLLTFAAIANAIPWAVFSVHGRRHLEDIGFGSTLAAALLGLRVGVSTLGRLAGSAGDFFPAVKVLALALLVTAVGLLALLLSSTPPIAYASVALLGLGYGAGYISIPVAFGDFFGRRAFAGTGGARIAIIGVTPWLGPRWAGAAADATGSYTSAFAFVALLCVLGSVASFLSRKPAVA